MDKSNNERDGRRRMSAIDLMRGGLKKVGGGDFDKVGSCSSFIFATLLQFYRRIDSNCMLKN